MKALMISIQPKWCELIANGKKTIEVRKTKPKLETPFKCYIYCTNPHLFSYPQIPLWLTENKKIKLSIGIEDGKIEFVNGKVIGEFVCDEIECLEERIEEGGLYYTLQSTFNEMAQLDNWELHDYGKGKPLFGWHISNLKIYDKPKKLSEFGLSRPPQSWCYVENDIRRSISLY